MHTRPSASRDDAPSMRQSDSIQRYISPRNRVWLMESRRSISVHIMSSSSRDDLANQEIFNSIRGYISRRNRLWSVELKLESVPEEWDWYGRLHFLPSARTREKRIGAERWIGSSPDPKLGADARYRDHLATEPGRPPDQKLREPYPKSSNAFPHAHRIADDTDGPSRRTYLSIP